MKLLCINNKPLPDTFNHTSILSSIKEGETYEGDKHLVHTPDGVIKVGWIIPSISTNKGFAIERFIPCDDSDETELVTEEFEEKYCVPVNAQPCSR